MEENQTNQNNLNQQPVQMGPVQPQPQQVEQQVQQPVQQQAQQQVQQGQQSVQNQPSVSMQIQQLLVRQQQYQQQYNQLVDYVKKTPNLPIEQVNQIKAQLDQLNALFVQGKQKLEALGYNQVQVTKPAAVKKGAKTNFSFKKLAVGCVIILVLILAGFFITLTSLIKDPNALQGIGIDAANAVIILQAFIGLLFGSIILLMLGVIISNIYRLITIKNQSKGKYVWGLIGGVIGAGIAGALIGMTFSWIGKIETKVEVIEYDLVQPYLIGRVKEVGKDEFNHPYDDDTMVGIGQKYPLIAPAEMAFSLRWNELERLMSKVETNYEIVSIKLLCGDKDNTVLDLSHELDKYNRYKFEGACLYSEKGAYTYAVDVTYDNIISRQRKTERITGKTLNFTSVVSLYKTSSTTSSSTSSTTALTSSNGEFILGKAPAKITADTTQIFRDFGLPSYKVVWDMDGDLENDRVDQVKFDYSYKIPKIYYATFNFPELSESVWYRFPVRVEPSDIPVCSISLTNFQGTTRYHIASEFMDPADSAKISSYNYTIKNYSSNTTLETLKNQSQEINYTLPEQGNYVVILDYVTVDGKQGRCESDLIQMKIETFDVEYSINRLDTDTGAPKEICNSKDTGYKGCTEITIDTIPHEYQIKIKSITPYSTTLKKGVFLDDVPLLNDDDAYAFNIPDEGTYNLKITASDDGKGIEEKVINIKFIAKKQDIVGNISITTADSKESVTEGFEPLTVVLDASKTEVNVEGDEIVYFDWDFGDGEVKRNQQNGVVVHTYKYDYAKENGIFQPKVKVSTLQKREKEIVGPTIYVKKGLITLDITSNSHPSRQAQIGTEVEFSAEFDGYPENMVWDFGDGSENYTCKGRSCAEVSHIFEKTGIFTIKLHLEFDAIQEVDGAIEFKVY